MKTRKAKWFIQFGTAALVTVPGLDCIMTQTSGPFVLFCFVFTMSCSRRKELSICCCVKSLKQAVTPSYTHHHLGKMMSNAVSHLGIPDNWMLRGLAAGVFHFLRMLRDLLKYPPVTRCCAILSSSSFQTFSSRQMI